MSELQKQAVSLISGLSDDNVRFLIEIIQRLMPQKSQAADVTVATDAKIQAFKRLDAAREEIKEYLPTDFDAEKELEEARFERYGNHARRFSDSDFRLT